MASTNSVSLNAEAWTLLYTSAAAGSSVTVDNPMGKTLKVRVGAAAAVGDAEDAAHVKIAPEGSRVFSGLANGDKVFGRAADNGTGAATTFV